ncbi:MAG: hypothetical protein CMH54_12985, partial [Myxococcales bacterium]|nr:hypothetical protein [Myxococcales bacterium]
MLLVILAMFLMGGCTRKRRPAPPPKVKAPPQDVVSAKAEPKASEESTPVEEPGGVVTSLEPIPVATSVETLMELNLPRVKGEFGVPDTPSVLVGMDAIGIYVAKPPNDPVDPPPGKGDASSPGEQVDATTDLEIVVLEDGKMKAEEKPSGPGIPKLITALKALKNFQNRVLAEAMSREYGDLSLYVDRKIPFATLAQVLQSLEQAGFRDYYFVVGPPEALTSIKNEVPRLHMRDLLPEDVEKLDHWQG